MVFLDVGHLKLKRTFGAIPYRILLLVLIVGSAVLSSWLLYSFLGHLFVGLPAWTWSALFGIQIFAAILVVGLLAGSGGDAVQACANAPPTPLRSDGAQPSGEPESKDAA